MDDESPEKLVKFVKTATHSIHNVFQHSTTEQKTKLNQKKYNRRRAPKKTDNASSALCKKRQYLVEQYKIQKMYTSEMLNAIPICFNDSSSILDIQPPSQKPPRLEFVPGVQLELEIPSSEQFLNNYIPSLGSPRENQALCNELYDFPRYIASRAQCMFEVTNDVHTGDISSPQESASDDRVSNGAQRSNNRVTEDDDFITSQRNTCGDIGRLASDNCGATQGNHDIPELSPVGAWDNNIPKHGVERHLSRNTARVKLDFSNVTNGKNSVSPVYMSYGTTIWTNSAVPKTSAAYSQTGFRDQQLLSPYEDDAFYVERVNGIFSAIENGSRSIEKKLELSSDSTYFEDSTDSNTLPLDLTTLPDEFLVNRKCFNSGLSSADLQACRHGDLVSKLPSFSSIFL